MPLDVDGEIQESFATHRDVLTAQALHLVDKVSLEDIMHPCSRLLLWLLLLNPTDRHKAAATWGALLALLVPLPLLPLPQEPFLHMLHDVIEEELHELVCVLVLRGAEQVIGLPQLCKEAPRCKAPNSPFLVFNLDEQLCQAHQEGVSIGVLLPLFGEVLDRAPPEGCTEVECLKHAVHIAGVCHVHQPEVLLAVFAWHAFAVASVLTAGR
mmetsp:Transcript_12863/g.40407  ORF Transcript_12863/g.40407 Transcript_12863/m.40407 type:complete len:211 (+) Transcript_12863:1430-2062(+)